VRARTSGTPVLLAVMATIAVAGWPPEVSPAFLDPAHQVAVRALRLFGMSAGQPLFHTDVNPWKQHAFCLTLRTDTGVVLFPPGGTCHVEGIHWRLPPVNRATHRMLSQAFEEFEAGPDPHADVYPAAIGRAFCLQPAERPREVQAVWTWYYKHYDDGSELRRNGLLFAYSCDEARLTTLAWQPDDAAVRRFWGGTPPWR